MGFRDMLDWRYWYTVKAVILAASTLHSHVLVDIVAAAHTNHRICFVLLSRCLDFAQEASWFTCRTGRERSRQPGGPHHGSTQSSYPKVKLHRPPDMRVINAER